jgi:hypothetical protein
MKNQSVIIKFYFYCYYFRQLSSKTMDSQKLQAKNVIYSQWNLLNYLKSYLSKISNDKTVENALNNEFAHFLQKFQPTIYGPTDFWKYFNSLSPSLFKELQLFNKKENSLKKIEETRDNVKIQKVAKWKEKEIIISEVIEITNKTCT